MTSLQAAPATRHLAPAGLPEAMDEESGLSTRLLEGDHAAIAIVRSWVTSGLARFRARLREDLEDLEQEVLLGLLESLAAERFRGESRFETYVRSYVRFKCIDRLRAAGRRDFVELEDDLVGDAEPSPLDALTQREAAKLTRLVLADLPDQCLMLWEMIADGLSYREMSAATGLSEGAIRVRVHRCRQRALEVRRQLLSKGSA
jgi:RNA polymerase sigma factor (sigma-70 family)